MRRWSRIPNMQRLQPPPLAGIRYWRSFGAAIDAPTDTELLKNGYRSANESMLFAVDCIVWLALLSSVR
jgi:hypothetical protein